MAAESNCLCLQAFDDGGYGGELYGQSLNPALPAELAKWADVLTTS